MSNEIAVYGPKAYNQCCNQKLVFFKPANAVSNWKYIKFGKLWIQHKHLSTISLLIYNTMYLGCYTCFARIDNAI